MSGKGVTDMKISEKTRGLLKKMAGYDWHNVFCISLAVLSVGLIMVIYGICIYKGFLE